jgi:hypothetical protein
MVQRGYHGVSKRWKSVVHGGGGKKGRHQDPASCPRQTRRSRACQKTIDSGIADIILHGHILLADPYWPKKRKTAGMKISVTVLDVTSVCIPLRANQHFTCTVNPLCGMEKDYALTPAKEKKSVLIIGGGTCFE